MRAGRALHFGCPVSDGTGAMFKDVVVIGAGRAGLTIAARLREQHRTRLTGRDLACEGADLVLICTPDAAIAEVAQAIEPGPWICHVSGATRLEALAPHTRRFAVHPLQTLHADGGPEQLDGAFGAVSAESSTARQAGFELAAKLGLRPFELADANRPLYHAGATVAASFLVTLHRAAADLLERAGAPPEGIVPLMERVLERGFLPTGPHVRGDHGTVASHLRAIESAHPELVPLYRELGRATEILAAE